MIIGGGVAGAPIGAAAIVSLSVADPLPGLISDPAIPRTFLFRAAPTGGAVDLASHAVMTDGQRFDVALPAPYNFDLSLPLPDLRGGATGASAFLPISNGDAAHDAIVDYDWLGVECSTYVGPRGDVDISLFTRIFRGTAEGAGYDADQIRISLRDRRSRLRRRLETRRYYGTGACLRFDGTGDDVDFGDILDKGASDSFTVEVLFKSSVTGVSRGLASKKAGTATANPGWRFVFNAADRMNFDISDGSTAVTVLSGVMTPALDDEWHRATAVVNRTDQLIYLYLDGALVATSASIAAVGDTSSTAALQLGTFVTSSLCWEGDLDDFRMWPEPRTAAEIQDAMHRELTAAEAATTDIYCSLNEATGVQAGDTSGNARHGSITGAAWVGSLEGGASVAGQPKPALYGRRRQIEPVLVDSQFLVYQCHNGSIQAILAVRDNGDPLSLGSDSTNIYAATPTPGTYNTDLSRGLIRLQSAPLGALTIEAEGDDGGALGYQDTAGGIARKILTERMGLTDPDDLDIASFAALALASTATVGHYWTDGIDGDAALDEVLGGISGWWAPDRTGLIAVGRIEAPTMAASTTTWSDTTGGGIIAWSREPLRAALREVIVRYRPYGRALTTDESATSLSLEVREDYSRLWRQVSAPVVGASDDALSLIVESSMDDEAAARAEAERLRDWLADGLNRYSLLLDSGGLAYFLGTVSTVVSTRYQHQAGVPVVVVGLSESMGTYELPDQLEVTAVG